MTIASFFYLKKKIWKLLENSLNKEKKSTFIYIFEPVWLAQWKFYKIITDLMSHPFSLIKIEFRCSFSNKSLYLKKKNIFCSSFCKMINFTFKKWEKKSSILVSAFNQNKEKSWNFLNKQKSQNNDQNYPLYFVYRLYWHIFSSSSGRMTSPFCQLNLIWHIPTHVVDKNKPIIFSSIW